MKEEYSFEYSWREIDDDELDFYNDPATGGDRPFKEGDLVAEFTVSVIGEEDRDEILSIAMVEEKFEECVNQLTGKKAESLSGAEQMYWQLRYLTFKRAIESYPKNDSGMK